MKVPGRSVPLGPRTKTIPALSECGSFNLCTQSVPFAILAAIVPDSTGVGSDHPLISPLLDEYSDVFATEIPGGLPPERTGIDGKPIQHEIHTDPDVKPFARSPPPAYAKEMEALRDYLKDFLAKNWISPSLSPWAAPVCSSPKRWTL